MKAIVLDYSPEMPAQPALGRACVHLACWTWFFRLLLSTLFFGGMSAWAWILGLRLTAATRDFLRRDHPGYLRGTRIIGTVFAIGFAGAMFTGFFAIMVPTAVIGMLGFITLGALAAWTHRRLLQGMAMMDSFAAKRAREGNSAGNDPA